MFINIRYPGQLQAHPFTLSSSPQDDALRLHIRIVGDWTNWLKTQCLAAAQTQPPPLHSQPSNAPLPDLHESHSMERESDRHTPTDPTLLITGGAENSAARLPRLDENTREEDIPDAQNTSAEVDNDDVESHISGSTLYSAASRVYSYTSYNPQTRSRGPVTPGSVAPSGASHTSFHSAFSQSIFSEKHRRGSNPTKPLKQPKSSPAQHHRSPSEVTPTLDLPADGVSSLDQFKSYSIFKKQGSNDEGRSMKVLTPRRDKNFPPPSRSVMLNKKLGGGTPGSSKSPGGPTRQSSRQHQRDAEALLEEGRLT